MTDSPSSGEGSSRPALGSPAADRPDPIHHVRRHLARLASAVDVLEQRRDQLNELENAVNALGQFDMIVVEGEAAVLAKLAAHLPSAREALAAIASDSDDVTALDRLEALVAPRTWSALDEVQRQLAEKSEIANLARAEVQRRLRQWEIAANRIKSSLHDIQEHRLHVVEPREVAASRHRLDALLRQATNGYKDNQLLDAWRALDGLDSTPATAESTGVGAVPPREVSARLDELINRARETAGRLQLTVLRGPLDRGRFEYTLMLLTPTGDRHIGVNVQDSTTIVMGDRGYFLRETDAASNGGYRALRALGDGNPPPGAGRPGAETMKRLRDMGIVLYRLLVPDRMKEEMRHHRHAPLTVITNDLEVPWELMYDDEDFLALSRPVARMPVGRARARRTPTLDGRPRRRRVALVASAGSEETLPGSVREITKIERSLRRSWGDEVIIETFTSGTERRPTGERFRELLMSGGYDIIHYAGHAIFDIEHQDQSGLLLEDDEVCFAQKIQRLLQGNPLVFLNACETARLGEGDDRPPPESAYEGDPKEGLASAFVYGGALACIGTMWPVIDAVAAEFAVVFYGQALEGQPLGEAMRVARKAMADKYVDDPSWAAFVLYGDPSFSLGTPTPIIAAGSAP